MKSVLEELYYGNIRPFAKCRIISEEKQKLLQSLGNYHNKLLDSMIIDQKKLWQEYETSESEIMSQSECEIFIDGIRLGMRLALELLEG